MAGPGEPSPIIRKLDETIDALEGLRTEVARQGKQQARFKIYNVLLALGLVAVVVLGALFYWDDRNDDRAFTRFAVANFLRDCENTNTARLNLQQDNTQDAELLIAISGADQSRPDLAEGLRRGVEEQNKQWEIFDCQAELRSLGDEVQG